MRTDHVPHPVPANNLAGSLVAFSPSLIRIFGEISQKGKKLCGLANEKTHIRKEFHHTLGHTLGFGWTDNGAHWELLADKRARFRHDQVGSQVLTRLR